MKIGLSHLVCNGPITRSNCCLYSKLILRSKVMWKMPFLEGVQKRSSFFLTAGFEKGTFRTPQEVFYGGVLNLAVLGLFRFKKWKMENRRRQHFCGCARAAGIFEYVAYNISYLFDCSCSCVTLNILTISRKPQRDSRNFSC